MTGNQLHHRSNLGSTLSLIALNFILPASVIGSVLLISGLWSLIGPLSLSVTAQTWPATSGRIVATGTHPVEHTYWVCGIPHGNGFCHLASQTCYVPAAQYSYTVRGQPYVGNRINASEVYSCPDTQAYLSRSEAEAAIKPYVHEKVVTVYYNPSQPQDSVLNRHGELPFELPLLGVILLAASTGTLWLTRRLKRAAQPETGIQSPHQPSHPHKHHH